MKITVSKSFEKDYQVFLSEAEFNRVASPRLFITISGLSCFWALHHRANDSQVADHSGNGIKQRTLSQNNMTLKSYDFNVIISP
jgi:hypothetical protein